MGQYLCQCPAFHAVFQIRNFGIEINRRCAFFPEPVEGIFVTGDKIMVLDTNTLGNPYGEALSRILSRCPRFADISEQCRIVPDGLLVLAPEAVIGPTRQRLTGVPFALTIMQQPSRSKSFTQAQHQIVGEFALVFAIGMGIPLVTFHIIDRDKGRFPSHGQSHIAGHQIFFHLFPQGVDQLPLIITVGFGHARIFMQAMDSIAVFKGDVTGAGRTGQGRRTCRMGGTGQGDMPLAGQQPGGGIKTDPAGTRDINLGPGMEVGKVSFRSRRSIKGFFISAQLHQITTDKARGQP